MHVKYQLMVDTVQSCVMSGVNGGSGYSYIQSEGHQTQQAALEGSGDLDWVLSLTSCDSPYLDLGCLVSEMKI